MSDITCPNEGCGHVLSGWGVTALIRSHRRRCDAATPAQRVEWRRTKRNNNRGARWDSASVKAAGR